MKQKLEVHTEAARNPRLARHLAHVVESGDTFVQQSGDDVDYAQIGMQFDQQPRDLDRDHIEAATITEKLKAVAAEAGSALQTAQNEKQEEQAPGRPAAGGPQWLPRRVRQSAPLQWMAVEQAPDRDADESESFASEDDALTNTDLEDGFSSSGDDSDPFEWSAPIQMVRASVSICFEVIAEICPRGYKEGADKAAVNTAVAQLLTNASAGGGFVWDSAEPLGDGWTTRGYFTNRKAFKRHLKTNEWRHILQISDANCNRYSRRLYMPNCRVQIRHARCWTGETAGTCPSERAILRGQMNSLVRIFHQVVEMHGYAF